jgi:hypothetical protein
MTIRRTTLAAEHDDLAVLEGEAKRRGVSLAHLMRELVAREASGLREHNRPRFGVARSDEGSARVAQRDEHAPARRRGRG